MVGHNMAAANAGLVACPVDTDVRFAPMEEAPREEERQCDSRVLPS